MCESPVAYFDPGDQLKMTIFEEYLKPRFLATEKGNFSIGALRGSIPNHPLYPYCRLGFYYTTEMERTLNPVERFIFPDSSPRILERSDSASLRISRLNRGYKRIQRKVPITARRRLQELSNAELAKLVPGQVIQIIKSHGKEGIMNYLDVNDELVLRLIKKQPTFTSESLLSSDIFPPPFKFTARLPLESPLSLSALATIQVYLSLQTHHVVNEPMGLVIRTSSYWKTSRADKISHSQMIILPPSQLEEATFMIHREILSLFLAQQELLPLFPENQQKSNLFQLRWIRLSESKPIFPDLIMILDSTVPGE